MYAIRSYYDRVGASIAATHKPALYYHGDQAWWIASFGDGRVGAVHLTDAHWDPVSRTQSIAISVPLYQVPEDLSFLAGRFEFIQQLVNGFQAGDVAGAEIV